MDVCASLAGHTVPPASHAKLLIAAPYEVRLSQIAPGTNVLPAIAVRTLSDDPVRYPATVRPESLASNAGRNVPASPALVSILVVSSHSGSRAPRAASSACMQSSSALGKVP